MKALTVCQPYAQLIALGIQMVENRPWPTHYRGPLAIHAGKSPKWRDRDLEFRHGIEPEDMAFGAVVAVVELVCCLRIRDVRRCRVPLGLEWVRRHAFTSGPWCWVLGEEVRRLAAPVPWRGERGLWELPDTALTAEHAEGAENGEAGGRGAVVNDRPLTSDN